MKSRGAVRSRAGTKGAVTETKTQAAVLERPLRPAQCRRFMRARLAEAFPGIVQGFVDGAKSGSCAHVKLATELLAEPERKRSQRKGSAVRLLEQLGGA